MPYKHTFDGEWVYDTTSGESTLIIQSCLTFFLKIWIIPSEVPETLTQIALSQKGSLVTHKNEKSPGVAGSQVTVRTRSLSISQLHFPLFHLHFNVHFLCKGLFSQKYPPAQKYPWKEKAYFPVIFIKVLG